MRDNLNNMQVVDLGTLALSGTTPAASAWVDLTGFESCTLVLRNNTVTDAGAAAGFTATLQEGSTTAGSSATAVAAADSVNGVVTIDVTSDSADDVLAGALGYKGSKKYARLNVVGTSGTSAGVTVLAILGNANRVPTTFIGTKVAAT